MSILTMQNHPPPTPLSTTNPTVAFTTPSNYANRLSHLLTLKGLTPLWCPTVTIQCTPQTKSFLKPYLSPLNPIDPTPPLDRFSAVAFTSRTGISAFADAMSENDKPPLSPFGELFTIAALGKDSTLIDEDYISMVCENPKRVRILVPPTATPTGLVEALGDGRGRRVLCPVPMVVGLEEPPVIPNFLRELGLSRWMAVRVNGYETRWAGPECAEGVAARVEEGYLDSIVFTSTGEVEGLLKSLREFGLDWGMVRKRCRRLVVAAHGPVTAAGAERLGVDIDVNSGALWIEQKIIIQLL
ncbi:hypothetical protein L1049_001298 [Liquidambar formosana]|uniref:Tetrapyrrole biosynthesis uroporphyrinogen III synthase domain-containing protein n=1 Tax=Liquidambar formosana TaxID=63359 RepID=A0AAP0NAC8_LIQFO